MTDNLHSLEFDKTQAELPFDERAFRDALSHYASGLTIVSGVDTNGPTGLTCQSFYSVSMTPPLISFSVMATSTTYPRIRKTRCFAVNVLASDQRHVADQFARKGTNKWAGLEISYTPGGNPLIAGTVMWLDCTIWAEYEAGDHNIVIGEVRDINPPSWHRDDPLVFFKSRYHELRNRSSSGSW